MKKHIIEEKNGCLYPNKIKGWFFPNWFEKEHFETFIDKKLTDKQFEYIKNYLMEDTNLDDKISEIVCEYLNDVSSWEDFKL